MAALRLERSPLEHTVNLLKDNQETLGTSVVEFKISSSVGKVSKLASAFTTENVSGDMRVVDWSKHKHKFPAVGPRPIVDLLIGVDQADLLYALKDVKGKPGVPLARLTPLG